MQPQHSGVRMGIGTLIRFLVGQRQAIIDIATARGSLLVGALLVLSAGFAREYNQEDLLHDPWYLLIPLVASLVTSFVLFCLVFLAAQARGTMPLEFGPSYRRFLALYWMTAPLAWLYALPVEEFLSAGDSVRVNLSLLGLVSVWRVLLIARCSAVLFGASFLAAFFLVMFFADTLALVILFFTPLPVFNIMGGIPLTESEQVIREVACNVQLLGVVSWPVWLISAGVILGSNKREWHPLPILERAAGTVSIPLWTLCVLAIVVWFGILPSTQPPQQLRRTAEETFLAGEIANALALMSAHERVDFPPHWDPPPWHGYGEDKPPLLKVLRTIDERPTAEWVLQIYDEKLARNFRFLSWHALDDEAFAGTMELLRNPRYRNLIRENSRTLRSLSEYQFDDNPRRRAQIAELLRNHGVESMESSE